MYTLNGPPETNDASGKVNPGQVIQLSTPGSGTTVMSTVLSNGIDRDGTVTNYRIDLSSFNPAQGQLYIGNPANGGTLITNANNTITAANLANLYFDADDTNFTGVEIKYVAIDNDNLADPTPGTISLVPATGNLPPNSVDATALVEKNTPKQLIDTANNPFLRATDPEDAPNTLTYRIVDLPDAADGVLVLRNPGTGAETSVTNTTVLSPADLANLYFNPTPGFNGGSFTYRAFDEDGGVEITPATVTLQAAPNTNTVIENVPVDSTIAIDGIINGATIPLTDYDTPGGNDPDGSIASYEILTLPDPNDGTLYLGNPDNGGTLIEAGDKLPANRITDLVFVSSTSFNGTSFTYRAIDNNNNADPTPATVFLNAPPDTTSGTGEVDPGGVIQVTSVQMNLAIVDGNDPDDPATIAYTAPAALRYEIGTLPPETDGIFYLGNPVVGAATPVTAGQILSKTQLNNLYFKAANNFVGTTTLEYAAIDKLGLKDATPGVITISSSTGEPPETFDDRQTITPGTANPLDTPAVVGEDLDGTVERVKITKLPDATDGVLYIGAVSPANVVTLNQELTLEQFASLVFDAADTFNGGTFKYAAIDNTNLIDPEAATFTLDSPPETKDAIGKLTAGSTVRLSSTVAAGTSLMSKPLTEGSDPEDVKPTQYRIDVSTITEGQLYLGDPNNVGTPGVLITTLPSYDPSTNTVVIGAADLDDLYFKADPSFDGGVEIEYVAIDSIGGEDPTPGKIYLNPQARSISTHPERTFRRKLILKRALCRSRVYCRFRLRMGLI
ncbi:MAG: hypothetical protein EAZ61_14275 [Oscillatoriales cyanobacterium]|nr:MAG: hypothetical protein EAZ61_14275 [Oscillatoriales cyanobacterium]